MVSALVKALNKVIVVKNKASRKTGHFIQDTSVWPPTPTHEANIGYKPPTQIALYIVLAGLISFSFSLLSALYVCLSILAAWHYINFSHSLSLEKLLSNYSIYSSIGIIVPLASLISGFFGRHYWAGRVGIALSFITVSFAIFFPTPQ